MRSFSLPSSRSTSTQKASSAAVTALPVGVTPRNTNLTADQTFAGSLASNLTCSKCSATKQTIDPTLDIQLDMPLGATNTLTLGALLRRFCAPERLDHGGKGYSCEKCGGGKGVYATKQMTIKKLPPVLAFQLKVRAPARNH